MLSLASKLERSPVTFIFQRRQLNSLLKASGLGWRSVLLKNSDFGWRSVFNAAKELPFPRTGFSLWGGLHVRQQAGMPSVFPLAPAAFLSASPQRVENLKTVCDWKISLGFKMVE